jgi:hypothetical protein
MPETARPRVDEHRHLPLPQAVRSRGPVEDLVDPLHLDEVVAGAHRPELPAAALLRALRHRAPIRTFEPPARLRALDILRPLRENTAAVTQHALEVDRLSALAAHAGRNRARDLVHKRRPPRSELADVER